MREKKILRLVNKYESSPTIRNALAALTGLYALWLRDGNEERLIKGYNIAANIRDKNPNNFKLIFFQAIYSMELGRLDYAEDLLALAAPYRKYLKNENPEDYCLYLYVSWALNKAQGKRRAAAKQLKLLGQYVAAEKDIPGICLMLPGIILIIGAMDGNSNSDLMREASAYLTESYYLGCRSPFLFLALDQYYQSVITDDRLLLPWLNWALSNELPLDGFLQKHERDLPFAISNQSGIYKRLYEKHPVPWLLQPLCRDLAEENDYSQQAFEYYNKAEKEGLTLPRLELALVFSAFRNGITNLEPSTIERFLSLNIRSSINEDLKAFVYSLLVISPPMKYLAGLYKNDLLIFTLSALERKIRREHYPNLYAYLLTLSVTEPGLLKPEIVKEAENLTWESLFAYKIYLPGAESLYVKEKEKEVAAGYKMKAGKAVIKAARPSFTLIFLDGKGRKVLDGSKAVVTKLIHESEELLTYFYRKGYGEVDLLIALASYYMGTRESDPNAFEPINRLLTKPGLSAFFKTKVNIYLGNLTSADERCAEDKYIEPMLKAFMQNEDFERASGLILKRPGCISDKAMFFALKGLAGDRRYHQLAGVKAYGLLINSWQDEQLLDHTLKYYQGSQEEWQALSKALSSIPVFKPELDIRILKNCVLTHKMDEGSQRVFVRMFNNDPDNPVMEDFIYYCVYEVLINNFKPLYETLGILEKIYLSRSLSKGNSWLAYALSQVYLKHKIITFHSDEILSLTVKEMEKEGLLMPVFKESKDKISGEPYIEKNQTFMYKTLPGRRVFIYYRFADKEAFSARPMEYLRYGLYHAKLPLFYNEKISYYFSEEMDTGSINTKEYTLRNERIPSLEKIPTEDLYFKINSAVVHEQMLQYDKAEEILEGLIEKNRRVRGRLM